MSDLTTRLEEAAEGSRELDLRVFEHFDRANGERWTEADLNYALTDPDRTINPPHLTTSLDAALALAERVLGGLTSWRIEMLARRVCLVHLVYAEGTEHQTAEAATPALALCAAVLRANHKDKP